MFGKLFKKSKAITDDSAIKEDDKPISYIGKNIKIKWLECGHILKGYGTVVRENLIPGDNEETIRSDSYIDVCFILDMQQSDVTIDNIDLSTLMKPHRIYASWIITWNRVIGMDF